MKPNFKLPNTKQSIIRYSDNNGLLKDVLITTPPNNSQLFHMMLMNHHVGYGQIRAIKAVTVEAVLPNNFRRNFKTGNQGRLEPLCEA